MPTVLILENQPSIAVTLDVPFALQGIKTLTARSPGLGLEILSSEPVDLVIQDTNFAEDTTNGAGNETLFRTIQQRYPEMPLLLLTSWGGRLERAVQLVRAGAADYLAEPWDDGKLLATVNDLLGPARTRRDLHQVQQDAECRRSDLAERFDLCGTVFVDAASERAVALACKVARADVPVLISGPNGSGKEKIAEIVRANSAVKDGPFVALNCGALPGELIEAELFGVEAGAYTGARQARQGKFEAADGGTLFLDEIGTLPPAGQTRLLRIMETGTFERLGSNHPRRASVRVISATNADLPAMIEAGTFRKDLYYRLNAVEIALPALAERPDDILPLAKSFLPIDKVLSADAQVALRRHPWPGNVRELKNTIQRGVLLARSDEVTAADLLLGNGRLSRPAAGAEPRRSDIEAALARNAGVIARAAAELGLSRQALYRRMEKLSIRRA